jgi:predicted ATP-grasp superfamily ATP-dependent carboligase
MINVLVTDGEGRSTLAVTRSLGKKGCRVVVTGKDMPNLSSSSRYCEKAYQTPDPFHAGKDYSSAIAEIVAKEDIQILIPMTEQSIYLLNPIREDILPACVLACPTAGKISLIANKVSLFKRAEKIGVAIPKTFYLNGPDDLAAKAKEIKCYPVVVKPALSRIQDEDGFISGGVNYADSQDELENLYATQKALCFPSMIQERIIGEGTGLFTLYDTNQHLALFSHRRLREKPPAGGVSVVCESVSLDADMVEASDKLLASVDWTGVAMVEFKRDVRDGKAKLMEINGRFWGSLQLAIACEVDFPALFLDQLQKKFASQAVGNYRVGHKLKWFFGTLDHLIARLRYSDEELKLPPGSPSRWQSVLDFLKTCEKNSSFDVCNWSDLKPFLLESRNYARDLIRVSR